MVGKDGCLEQVYFGRKENWKTAAWALEAMLKLLQDNWLVFAG